MFQDGLYGLNKGRLVGCSGYEIEASERPYEIKNPDAPFHPSMVPLRAVNGYFNHACAIIDLARRAPADPIIVRYYQFMSCAADDRMPDPLPPMEELNCEQVGG